MNNQNEIEEYLLDILDEIDRRNGNKNFSIKFHSELSKRLKKSEEKPLNESNKFYEDIKRTKYFLRHIDKDLWVESLKYYNNVKYPELKIELAKDFKEMKIADRNDDITEYARRLILQIENGLNTIISIIGAHSIILKNPKQYKEEIFVNGKYGFFKDRNKRELKDISIIAKVNFARIYYKLGYYDFNLFNEMNRLRTLASHRGTGKTNGSESERSKKKSEFFKVFDTIIKGLKDLYY